ncbi:MAG: TonB-dependent receptor [Armatimonadota bacterium]|nr:MAG: TonB-dependent receptor [Armatimonadota bacterium]
MLRSPWPTALLAALCVSALVSSAGAVVTTGILSGQVLDVETGEPLAGVNVRIQGTALTTVSDADGAYLITNIPPGTYDVSASLVGYVEAINTGVAITQDETATLDFGLEPTVLEVPGAEAKVTAAQVQVRPAVTATTYTTTSEEEQYVRGQPNDLYQFPGIVFGQPGVVADATGYPHIRGARDDQVGYMLEGIPIVEPNNNVFATNIVTVGLDRMDLYTGGYPASYPGYVGGVINEVIKRGDQVRGGFVDTSVGSPWDYRALLLEAGNVVGPWNWYYQSNIWRSDFLDNNFLTSCEASSDAIVKAIYTASANDNLTLLANHGYARYLFPFSHTQSFDPSTGLFEPVQETRDFGRQGYNLDAVTWSHSLSPKAFYTLRGYRLENWLRLDLSSDEQGFWQDRLQQMYGLQLNYTGQVAPKHLLYAGAWHIWGDNNMLASGFMPPIFPPVLEYSADNDTRNLQAYIGDRWRVTDELTLDVGVRHDSMDYDRSPHSELSLSQTSPRAGATYAVNDATLLRGSWGKYAQMPAAKYTRWTFIDRGLTAPIPDYFGDMTQGEIWPLFFAETSPLKPQVDTAFDVGVETRLAPNLLLNATYFQRDSEQLVQRWHGPTDEVFDWSDVKRYASNGHGTATGIEAKLQRRLARDWEGWLSYTYMRAKATAPYPNAYPWGVDFGDLDAEYYLPWDQRHTATLALNHKRGNWEFNPWVAYGSGYAYGQSGIDLGGPDYQHMTLYTDLGEPYDVPIQVNGELQPNNPNALRTGDHWLCSLNITYHVDEDQDIYVALHNIFSTKTATNLAWYDENTLEVLPGAYQPPAVGDPGPGNEGYITYVPYTYNPPFFAAIGIRQRF